MTIPHFADEQNLVFVPALLALLVATLAVCLPIVFAPALRRGRSARTRVLLVLLGFVAGSALVTGGVQGGLAVRTLQSERMQLQADVRARYGLELTAAEAAELIDGGRPRRVLPPLAAQLGLEAPQDEQPLRLVASDEDAGAYDLTFGGAALPTG